MYTPNDSELRKAKWLTYFAVTVAALMYLANQNASQATSPCGGSAVRYASAHDPPLPTQRGAGVRRENPVERSTFQQNHYSSSNLRRPVNPIDYGQARPIPADLHPWDRVVLVCFGVVGFDYGGSYPRRTTIRPAVRHTVCCIVIPRTIAWGVGMAGSEPIPMTHPPVEVMAYACAMRAWYSMHTYGLSYIGGHCWYFLPSGSPPQPRRPYP